MDCYSFRELISAYIDGELNLRMQSEFQAHDSSCPACHQIYINTLKTVRSLRELPELVVSEDFMRDLRFQIQNIRDQKRFHIEQHRFSFRSIPSYVYGSAAAVLIISVGLLVMKFQGNSEVNLASPQQSKAVPERVILPAKQGQVAKSSIPSPHKTTTQDSSRNKQTRPRFDKRIRMVNDTE